MAKQTINIGTAPNDGTGTPLRTAFDYCNLNFTELYTAVGPSGNNIVVPGTATITGNLTVDTNTLFVDAANNRVGVGTATPAVRMELVVADAAEGARFTASSAWLRMFPYLDATDKTKIQAVNGTNTALSDLTLEGLNLRFNTNAGLAYAISNTGVATWSNVGGVAGTAMTLNSTGLGVGVTPSAWNSAVKAIQSSQGAVASNGITTWFGANVFYDSTYTPKYIGTNFAGSIIYNPAGFGGWDFNIAASGTAGNTVTFTTAMKLDASGRLILLASTTTPATLTTNGELTMTATSNTNLRFSYRGSDGTTRVANITLA
jgi:hypothetical protein